MSETEHKVVLYVCKSTRQFSATARKQTSSLPGVDRQMSEKGYKKLLVADRLEANTAKDLKSQIELVCTELGYRKFHREQLYARVK